MNILEMKEEHISRLVQLENTCFSQPWSEASLLEELKNPVALFLVAEEVGTVFGYAGMHLISGVGYVDNIAVFPQYRNKGVGRALLRALMDRATDSLSLEVRVSNAAAIHLYQSMGFFAVGRRKNFYCDPTEDALIYTLDQKVGLPC